MIGLLENASVGQTSLVERSMEPLDGQVIQEPTMLVKTGRMSHAEERHSPGLALSCTNSQIPVVKTCGSPKRPTEERGCSLSVQAADDQVLNLDCDSESETSSLKEQRSTPGR